MMGYCLTRKVKDPQYGTDSAGCLDFFVPYFDDDFLEALRLKNLRLHAAYDSEMYMDNIRRNRNIKIMPGEDIIIPSGVHVRLEPNTALTAFNKSGVATKLKLIRGAEYVDCDYMGEVHLHVINVGTEDVYVAEGDKLVQFSYVPVLRAMLLKTHNKEDLYANFDSNRGEGWQGSTGTK